MSLDDVTTESRSQSSRPDSAATPATATRKPSAPAQPIDHEREAEMPEVVNTTTSRTTGR